MDIQIQLTAEEVKALKRALYITASVGVRNDATNEKDAAKLDWHKINHILEKIDKKIKR